MARKTRHTPNRLGTVEQLPSGRYRAAYRLDGRKFSAPTTYRTKDEALAWLASERTDRSRGVWRDPDAGRITLAEYANVWLASRVNLAERTASGYRATLDGYVLADLGTGASLAGCALADLTPAHVRRWLAAVAEKAERSALERTTPKPTSAAGHEHPARTWAREHGYQVKPSGRLPREVLEAYRTAADRTPTPIRRTRTTQQRRADATGRAREVRAWGTAHGFTVAPTGRLSPALVAAWRTAQAEAERTGTGHALGTSAQRPGANATARAYATLRAVCNAAVEDGHLTSSPCTIRGAATVRAAERTPATPEEVTAIADAMPADLAAAVLVAAWSGLRFGELFALARRHVDLETGAVTVQRALTRDRRFTVPKTRSSQRVVYLPRFVLDVLADHMTKHTAKGPDALLWASSTGAPVRQARVSKHFRTACAHAGRPDLRWHDLRHTGATLAYLAGGNVRDVQRRLGHSTARAAMIYAHAADQGDQRLAEALDALHAPANVVPIQARRRA